MYLHSQVVKSLVLGTAYEVAESVAFGNNTGSL